MVNRTQPKSLIKRQKDKTDKKYKIAFNSAETEPIKNQIILGRNLINLRKQRVN